MVADTGSTNGTFINGERIAYGKAFVVKDGDKLKFGTVEVRLNSQTPNSKKAENQLPAKILRREKRLLKFSLPIRNSEE